MKVAELKEIAEQLEINGADKLKKQDLIYKILDEQAVKDRLSSVETAPSEAPAPSAEAYIEPREETAKPKRERIRRPPKRERIRRPAALENQSNEVENTSQGELFGGDESKKSDSDPSVPEQQEAVQRELKPVGEQQNQPRPQNPNQQHQQNRPNNQGNHQNRQQQQQQNNPNIFRPDRSKRGQADEHGYNFDGIVIAEGVLEIMPDGFGFYHARWFWFFAFRRLQLFEFA